MEKVFMNVKEIAAANILEVAVGTTGYKGGDYGHGSRLRFRLSDKGGTAWKVTVDGVEMSDPRSIQIDLGGDMELQTFASALDFALRALAAKDVNPDFLDGTVEEEDIDWSD